MAETVEQYKAALAKSEQTNVELRNRLYEEYGAVTAAAQQPSAFAGLPSAVMGVVLGAMLMYLYLRWKKQKEEEKEAAEKRR